MEQPSPARSTTQKKQIITIAGRPGSGKSTTAKTVAAELGFQHFSSGDLFRAIAKEHGVDVLQANLSAETNRAIDDAVDGRLRDINEKEDQIVIDSRTAWHWMPASFKVFLDLDLEAAAVRILKSMDYERLKSENISTVPAEYAKVLERRLASESKRYKALYNIDPYVMDNYDLVINTGDKDVEEVVAKVISAYRAWLQG